MCAVTFFYSLAPETLPDTWCRQNDPTERETERDTDRETEIQLKTEWIQRKMVMQQGDWWERNQSAAALNVLGRTEDDRGGYVFYGILG